MSSSALTNLVPILTGENSVVWFQQMTVYLMSTGEWDIIEDYLELTVVDVFSHVVDVPAVMSPGGQHVSTAATTRTQNDLCIATNDSYLRLSEDYVEHLKSTAEWKAKDSKVRGHILLRCSTAIQKKIKNEDCAFDMWKVLQGDYAVVGTSGIYNVFLKFLHIHIPAKGNPVQAIDKMEDHVRELEELNVTIPKFMACFFSPSFRPTCSLLRSSRRPTRSMRSALTISRSALSTRTRLSLALRARRLPTGLLPSIATAALLSSVTSAAVTASSSSASSSRPRATTRTRAATTTTMGAFAGAVAVVAVAVAATRVRAKPPKAATSWLAWRASTCPRLASSSLRTLLLPTLSRVCARDRFTRRPRLPFILPWVLPAALLTASA